MANLEVLALDEATPQIRAPGSGDGYTMPRPVEINPGTLTTDIKVLDLAATWNGGAVTFTGLKFNVTDTASAAGSLLADLQVGSASKFKVTKLGATQVGDGGASPAAGVPGMSFVGATQVGFRRNSTTGMVFTASGADIWFSGASNINMRSNGSYSWSNATNPVSSADVELWRDAASILAQRTGTTAQTNRLYRTYTDASNYQRLTHTWSTSTAVIHNEGAGTGADGSVAFNDAALATDATKGFVMIPSCAGTPTGTPADIPTGQVPIVFDSTNNKIYVYDGGWIATAALT